MTHILCIYHLYSFKENNDIFPPFCMIHLLWACLGWYWDDSPRFTLTCGKMQNSTYLILSFIMCMYICTCMHAGTITIFKSALAYLIHPTTCWLTTFDCCCSDLPTRSHSVPRVEEEGRRATCTSYLTSCTWPSMS